MLRLETLRKERGFSPDTLEVGEYRVEKEKGFGWGPLSYSQIAEFLTCPACWRGHREKHWPVPKSKEMIVSSFLHDLVADLHRPIDKEKIRFRSPKTLLSYMRKHHPRKLRGSTEGKQWLDFLESEEGQEEIPAISEAVVRYYLMNKQARIEGIERQINFKLVMGDVGEIPMVAILDQIKAEPIGDLRKKTGGRRRKFQRQIVELKRNVSPSRLWLSLQTGIQLLAYRAVYPDQQVPPKIVVYEFSTGKRFVRQGGDENKLIKGIFCAKRAMDLGFEDPSYRHSHYPQFKNQPQLYMEWLPGFEDEEGERIRQEGKRWQRAAREAFEDYDNSCSWEEIPPTVQVRRREEDHFEITLPNQYCFDCESSKVWMNLDGDICCPIHGRVGKLV